MAWKKSSLDAVQRFDALVAVQGAERGVLFGCPIYVLEGERDATLYQDQVVLRLSPADAADLISRGGRAFEPIKGEVEGPDHPAGEYLGESTLAATHRRSGTRRRCASSRLTLSGCK